MTLTEIISDAREITGYKTGQSASDLSPSDAAITAAMARYVRDINKVLGSGAGVVEKKFTAVAGQQDYDIVTYVGSDVLEIEEVLRSGAFTPNHLLPVHDDCLQSGYQQAGYDVIPAGVQADVFETIVQQERADRADRYSWEEAPGRKIRLLPPPHFAETIAVKYTTTGSSIDDLDSIAQQAMTDAACMEILNMVLNRLPGLPVTNEMFGQYVQKQIQATQVQRDYYRQRYLQELAELGKS